MNKCNKNLFVFIAFGLAVIAGLYGGCAEKLAANLTASFNELKNGSAKGSVSVLKNTTKILTESISYHDILIDCNSLKNNLTNARFVQNGDSKTVKCEYDMLALANETRFDADSIDRAANKIVQLQNKAEENGAKFLYLAVPEKGYYQTFPSNVRDYSRVNFDDYLACMQEKNIPFLSYVDEFQKRDMDREDIYYYTDTHWKTNVGFLAAQLACRSLHERYGIPLDDSKLDIGNYKQTFYPDWFLGALGKKTGTFFTWRGPDDFTLITPNFATSFTEEKPYENSVREGSFEDTVLYGEQIYEKDYYHHDPYSGYCGGNHRLQIFKNHLENNGKKALFIRDSFSHVVTPYLALQFQELHVIDTRGEDIELYDEKVNWYEYLQTFKPDVVLVLYKGVPYDGMLDFEGKLSQ